MTTQKHTPGPWRVSRSGFDVLHPTDNATLFQAVPHARMQANAHVAAAAPELLEIVRAYVRLLPAFRLKPFGAPGSDARAAQDAYIAAEDAAVAAIAKAEGRTR